MIPFFMLYMIPFFKNLNSEILRGRESSRSRIEKSYSARMERSYRTSFWAHSQKSRNCEVTTRCGEGESQFVKGSWVSSCGSTGAKSILSICWSPPWVTSHLDWGWPTSTMAPIVRVLLDSISLVRHVFLQFHPPTHPSTDW